RRNFTTPIPTRAASFASGLPPDDDARIARADPRLVSSGDLDRQPARSSSGLIRAELPLRPTASRHPLSIRVVAPTTIPRVSDTWPPPGPQKREPAPRPRSV